MQKIDLIYDYILTRYKIGLFWKSSKFLPPFSLTASDLEKVPFTGSQDAQENFKKWGGTHKILEIPSFSFFANKFPEQQLYH